MLLAFQKTNFSKFSERILKGINITSHTWMSQSAPLQLKENRKKSQRINLGYEWAIKGRNKQNKKKA